MSPVKKQQLVRNKNIAKRWDDGLTLVQISKEYNLSHGQVDRILQKLGAK